MNNFNPFDAFSVFKSKKYWKCLGVIVVCFVAMILLLVPLAILTGSRELEEFGTLDWVWLVGFGVVELALLFVVVIFVVKIIRLGLTKGNEVANSYFIQFKFVGLENVSNDYVWLNFKGVKRAVILEQNGVFNLSLEKFNSVKNPWVPIADEQFTSLEEVKKALYYKYDFYCEENANIDEFGNKTFKN